MRVLHTESSVNWGGQEYRALEQMRCDAPLVESMRAEPGQAVLVADRGEFTENLDYGSIQQGGVSAAAGRAAVEWVLKAGELATAGEVQAIVTAPINKEAASLAGYKDIGHMEIFQSQTGAKEVATMLMAGELWSST